MLRFIFSIGLFLQIYSSHCQSVFSSEEDLKKQANKYFEEEEFGKAYPLFSQILSLYPKDAQYNYKFGASLLYAGNDKEKAIPYIEYAVKRQNQDVDKEVFFYLAKAYHLNYQFTDAIKYYLKYKGVASSRQLEKYDVDRQIEMCESGKKLLKNVSELHVLEKKEVPQSDFFRSYNLTEFNAKLIIKPDDLKSAYDKKKKGESLMYVSPDRNEIYYSSYGDDGKNGKDIYYVTRSPSGDLSKPTRVGNTVNTKYDEDYAFLHPNGKTLYFCSKGHNSMGGYDVFKSTLDYTTQTWGKAVNMDFAINTPDDDILFISDAEDKSAYFSSKRESAEGLINVYKIRLERKPLDLAIIAGVLTKNVGDKMAKATITVKKVLKDEVIGVFNTNAADGSYTLQLPNGGKFMFVIESAGFTKTSELVVIPAQKEIKPMKQEIALVNENGADKAIIKNDFDAQVDSLDLQLAIQYIKSKASLEVSSAEEEVTAVAIDENPVAENANVTEPKKATPVSNGDIIEMAYDDAKETQQDANELRRNSEAAQKLAVQKNDIALDKTKESQELVASAESITNQTEKLAQLEKATALKKQAELFKKEATLSFSLSNQLDEKATAKQQQADAEMKFAKELETAIKSNAGEKKINQLLVQKEELDTKSEQLKKAAELSEETAKQADEKQEEANKAMAKYLDLIQDVEDLQMEAKRLTNEAEKTKNEGVKQNLVQQAKEMATEADAKKKEADQFNVTSVALQNEVDSLKGSASLSNTVFTQTNIENTPASNSAVKSENATIQSKAVDETTSTTATNNSQTNSATQVKKEEPQSTSLPYVDVFVNEMYAAEKITDPLEKEKTLAIVYQSWTDSLDRQIASLNQKLNTESDETTKPTIQNKIYELQSSVEEKRQKAADSRSKVDNLNLQAALADASMPTKETETATTAAENNITNSTSEPEIKNTSPAETENEISGTKNINSAYENKLKEIQTVTNSYEKKVKEEELYQDWSASLYTESQNLRKEGKPSKADAALEASKEKQAIAIKTSNEATKIKIDNPELVATANLEKTEPLTLTAPDETKSGSSAHPINPEETKSTTETNNNNTIAETNQNSVEPAVSTNNTSSTSTAVKPSEQTPNITQTISTTPNSINQNTNDNPNASKNIIHKDEYTHYVSLKKESEWSKNNAARQQKQAEELQKEADKDFKQSQDMSLKISNTSNPNERQILREKSDALDISSLRKSASADSLKTLAKNSEAESNSKQTESDLFLQSLDKEAYEEITTATGGNKEKEIPAATSTSQNTIAQNTIETTPAIKNVEPELENTELIEPTKNTEPISTNATSTQKAENTSTPITANASNTSANSVVKNNPAVPVKNESASTNPAKQQNEPTSNQSAVNTNTENQLVNTNTPTKQLNETTSTSSLNTSSSSNAELLKYYDAIFDKLEMNGSSYSSNKPIPINAPMPEGLIFKVQIGAFRNEIPQDLFKGIKPITAESTPQGLKRYTAGLFQKFESANKAKTQVNNIGYRDAFVVAFYNGKRISMNEALTKAKESGEVISITELNNNNSSSVSSGTTSSTISGTSLANTTDVSKVDGLFYTIQIGVFSKPVTSSQLYNISPLNSERTANGLIRYTTGKYSNEAKAIQAKNLILQKGVADAFVIAYHNGKRVSISAAKEIIDSEGSSVISKVEEQNSYFPSDTTTTEASGKSLLLNSNAGITFRVQVGAFRERIPIKIANTLLTHSSKGIKTFRDDNGLLVYTIGEFLEYETANNLKEQLKQSGLSDAFVIGFREGKKISATEALEILKSK